MLSIRLLRSRAAASLSIVQGTSSRSEYMWQSASAVAAAGAVGIGLVTSVSTAECHGSSAQDQARIARLESAVEALQEQLKVQHDVRQTTGQGDAVFSWEQTLTKAFPVDAKPFEKDMHGGFNEDPKTGIVYTGIPG